MPPRYSCAINLSPDAMEGLNQIAQNSQEGTRWIGQLSFGSTPASWLASTKFGESDRAKRLRISDALYLAGDNRQNR